jgi:hypothetical protein
MKKKLEETAVYDEYVRWCGRSELAKANSSYPIKINKNIYLICFLLQFEINLFYYKKR